MTPARSKFADAFEAQQAAEQTAESARKSVAGFTPRQFERFEHHEAGEMLVDRMVIPVYTLNVSAAGLALQVPCARMPNVADLVSIRLCDGLHLSGSTVWIKGDRLGLKFDVTLENVGDVIHLENRGPSIYQSSPQALPPALRPVR